MIIIPLESGFGFKSEGEQIAITEDLQAHATAAHLAGIVVPVWEHGGRMAFRAPYPWHPFFQNLTLPFVLSNLNKEIFW